MSKQRSFSSKTQNINTVLMKKHIKCRTCRENKEYIGSIGCHRRYQDNLYCPNCKKITKTIIHTARNNSRLSEGEIIICNNCYDYLIYFNAHCNYIWRDELYLENYFLIRDLEYTETILMQDNNGGGWDIVYVLPFILSWENKENVPQLLKSMIPFS